MSMVKSTPPQTNVQVPSWKLLATLGVAGSVAGLLIVLSYQWAQPRVQKHNAEVLREAIEDVLHAPASADTLFLSSGKLTTTPPAAERAKAERIYRGFDKAGKVVGYAIAATEPGFADPVSVIFGYDPATKAVLGMRVLSSKETPGLGDKIRTDSSFGKQFTGVKAPIKGVKGSKPAGDPNALLMITGATISSRTVIRSINNAIGKWEPLMSAAPSGAIAAVGGGKP